MKLLDPKEIRQEKSDIIEEAHLRTQKLASEESKLVRQMNMARENSKKEIEEIDAGVSEHRKEKEHEKAIISSEIEGLKKQKEKLLAPIDVIRKEAEEYLQEAKKIKIEAEDNRRNLERDSEKNQDDAEDNSDWRDELEQRGKTIAEKEAGIEKENIQRKISANKLADEWMNYSKSVEALNKKIKENSKKESEIQTRETAVEIRVKALAEIDKKQYNKDREIKDKYDTLLATVESLRKKGIKI
jgi:hypothetical protein